jgi:hypothetical protein
VAGILMGRDEPVPSPVITKSYLAGVLGFFPIFLNREAAAGQHFMVVMAFTDPGVGVFTIEVADGVATTKEGDAPDADLVMTLSAATFEKTTCGILDPMEAIQSRPGSGEQLREPGDLWAVVPDVIERLIPPLSLFTPRDLGM